MFLCIFVFIVGFITMFPLKKIAQNVYNETGYNAVTGLAKFLTVLLGLGNIFLAFCLYVAIDNHTYSLGISALSIFILFNGLLTLINKKAGLKNAILLALLQNISGSVMVILLFFHRAFGGILVSNVLDILSINENK